MAVVISLDAMGGDNAPAAVLDGAVASLVRHPDVSFLLWGDQARLAPMLDARPTLKGKAEICHAEAVVGMDDKPSQALRRGRNTSMWLAIDAVKEGRAQACLSGGNTGALMAMALVQLRTLAGIKRPALASLWPTVKGDSVVLDLGANVECDAEDLVDFALMGAAFARIEMGLSRPTVGLLNIGAEELKGNEAVKTAATILKESGLPFEFTGFIEGDDISQGKVDVVVTDGFTGNVALKTAEGTAKLIASYLRGAFGSSILTKIGYVFASGALKILAAKLDPRAHNGGVFLGLNGLVVKSHGGTDGMGFAAALDMTIDLAKAQIGQKIAHDLTHYARKLAPPAAPEAPAALADPA